MKIRPDDTVLVISGRDRGKQGKVVKAFPDKGTIQVEGVNIVKKHMKPSASVRQAGIIEKEIPLSVAKVVLVCPSCNEPGRVGRKFLADGSKARVCKSCNEIIE
jgi:large subunit ribosomal protein L24